MRQGTAFSVPVLAFLFPLLAGATVDRPLPSLGDRSFPLQKTTLTISYNPDHKQADWVFYELGREQLRNCVDRTNRFQADPKVPRTYTADLEDYKSSGYNRGHLSPAGDNKFSSRAMNDSFLLSNISPQPPAFNQRIWARLENLVRAWALRTNGIWVTTGPVLQGDLETIGENEVTVPEFFYKIVVTRRASTRQAAAFLVPTTATGGSLEPYLVSIDELEEKTGLDFNQGMENEDDLEHNISANAWDFNASYKPLPCGKSFSTPQNLGLKFFQLSSIIPNQFDE